MLCLQHVFLKALMFAKNECPRLTAVASSAIKQIRCFFFLLLVSFLFGCYSCKGQKRKQFFFHTSPWLPLYGSSDGPELIEPSRARTFTRCFMSSTNVVALKGPGEGALRGHPDRKSPRSHSNFVTFHMHSICRRRKAFCLGPINTLATSVTTPQTPPPQIGIRP